MQAGEALAAAVSVAGQECVLLDGLGPWIAARLHQAGAFTDAERLPGVGREVLAELDRTAQVLTGAAAAIVVAEQAGEGVLPPDAASCAWVDLMGEAAQRFAERADRVDLVVAGRSIPLGCALPTPPADPSLRHHGDRDVRPGDADHAVNVMAGGPPPWLQAAVADALETDADRYPREAEAIAAFPALHGRQEREIVPTNGAAEALWLLGPSLRPTLAAILHPGSTRRRPPSTPTESRRSA